MKDLQVENGAAAAAAPPVQDYLTVKGLTKRYGSTTVLHDLDLSVGKGEFISLLGSSGCGKTTLLRLIAGLMEPNLGRIMVDGQDLTHLAPHKRNIGVVFQNYALFPHLSVAENVAFGLKARGAASAEIAAQVREALALVRMEAFADRPISALSGGQQQRIAVARALAVKPKLLLLDEPFSALDRNLREAMQIDLRRIQRKLGITSIFVTHDQDEALVMSDRIAVMSQGRIEQLGTPSEIYDTPETLYVMKFVGQSARLTGRVKARDAGLDVVETAFGTLRMPAKFTTGAEVILCVRPEMISVGGAVAEGENSLTLKLTESVYLGSRSLLHFEGVAEADHLVVEVERMPAGLVPGGEVTLRWPMAATMAFAP